MSPHGTRAALEAYDVLGRRVRSRSYAGLQPGALVELDLDLSDLAIGVYFLRFSAAGSGQQLGSRKVIVVR